MTEQTIAALLGVVGVMFAAQIATFATAQHRNSVKIDRTRAENHALWLYTRILIDHIYKGGGAPPPDPPPHIAGIYKNGESE